MELWRWENEVLWEKVLPHPASLQNGTSNIIAADWKQTVCQAPHPECRHLLLVMRFPPITSQCSISLNSVLHFSLKWTFSRSFEPDDFANILFCNSRRKENTSAASLFALVFSWIVLFLHKRSQRWTLHTCSISFVYPVQTSSSHWCLVKDGMGPVLCAMCYLLILVPKASHKYLIAALVLESQARSLMTSLNRRLFACVPIPVLTWWQVEPNRCLFCSPPARSWVLCLSDCEDNNPKHSGEATW